MSIEQPNPETVEATRSQIRRTVVEISELARSNIELQPFLDKFLAQIVSSMAAVGGAVWLIGEDGKSIVLSSSKHLPADLPRDAESQQGHAQLIGTVLTSGQPTIVRPGPWAGEADEGANPTPYLLLLAPMQSPRQPYGIVEVYQRAGADAQLQRGYLRFLVQMCELAIEFFKAREVQALADQASQWSRLDKFSAAVHRSLDVTQTAYTIANEACSLIECDRVSVIVQRRRRRPAIEAISGQDIVEKRANAVRLLLAVAQQVIKSGESFWYTGNAEEVPPQLEESLHAYLDESHTRTFGIVPITRQLEADPEDDESRRKSEILGALVVERIDQEDASDSMRHMTDLVSRRGTSALANALDHDRVFLMPVWKTLEKTRWFVEARRLPKTVAVVVAALLVLLGLCMIPADFNITAQGTLQPAKRRDVFVQETGVVSEVLVDQGDRVKAGTELLRLRSRDLEVQIAELKGRRAATLEQLASARRSEGDPRLSADERNRFSGQHAQYQKTYDSLTDQLRLQISKQQLLTVRSPIDGTVVTWDVKQRLGDRPVEKGQVLMSVADTQSNWELELLLPEAHSGFVTSSWEALPLDKRSLAVSYILATDPAQRLDGQVVEVQQSAEVRGEDGNTVMVRVKIDETSISPSNLKPGAAVTGRIYCGRRSIGYVWFHDVVAFVRSKILFRL